MNIMEKLYNKIHLNTVLALIFILDPRPWPEGPYEIGSIHLSVHKFSWNWLITFF